MAPTVGSGIRAEAASCGNSSVKPLKFGNAYAAAAPMRTKANDTTIADTRRDRPLGAGGCLSSWVSLFGVSACASASAVSATCVPHVVSRVRLGSTKQIKKEPSRGLIQRRLSRDCPPKIGLDHGLIGLMPSYRLSRLACAASRWRLRFLTDRCRRFVAGSPRRSSAP